MRRRRQGRSYIEREPAIDLNIVREVVYYIISTFIAVLVAVVIVRCFGLRIRMTGASMEPLLIDGQNVLVDRMHYRIASIEPGDVIVFYPGGNEDAHPFVKRVAAGPGQTVQITDGTLLIDGVPAPGAENYDKIEDPGLAKNPPGHAGRGRVLRPWRQSEQQRGFPLRRHRQRQRRRRDRQGLALAAGGTGRRQQDPLTWMGENIHE